MKIILAFMLTMILSSVLTAQDQINVIPKPQDVESSTGSFVLTRNTKIHIGSPKDRPNAEILSGLIEARYGFRLQITDKFQKRDSILIAEPPPNDQGGPNSEGYWLTVRNDSIKVLGTPQGQFYGIQTLMQLLPIGSATAMVPAVRIVDSPRFPYRGMHLDVSRHFFSVEFVKKYIDLMAQYKFNYFHWHLTDDQGWRVEIKKYPKLTEIGSKRPESVLGRNLQPYVGDKTPVEGFYTQDQIRDVVAYAKARYITVVPEIEIPGHSSAALAAYPELSCKPDQQYKVQTTWGIFKEVYCPTDKTFQFLQDVIDEVIALFPDSPYIHVGGDEVLKDMWKDSPDVQALMKRENLKDLNEVQSYIIQRMEKYINSKGKKIIGWDEILEGGLAPNATVMSWRGIKGGIEAAKTHHDVIMTPTDFAYFDYGQGDPATEPLNIGNYVPLEKVYSFDPVPKELTADETKYIIGGQANLWTEYIPDRAKAEYMVFPRMLAMAEDVWTMPENKNYADFLQRLSAQYARLDKEGINYRIPEPIGLHNMVLGMNGKAKVELKPSINGAKIYYTIDGSTPDESSLKYEKPFEVDIKPLRRIDLKTVTVLPSGRKSSVYAATILARDYLEPTELTEKRPGMTYAFTMPSTDGGSESVLVSGETRAVGFQQFAKLGDLKQKFSVNFDGYINVPTDGVYEFQAETNWDADISIDGLKLLNAFGTGERTVAEFAVALRAGLHRIGLRYNHGGGNALFRIRWGIKGEGLRAIGGGELFH